MTSLQSMTETQVVDLHSTFINTLADANITASIHRLYICRTTVDMADMCQFSKPVDVNASTLLLYLTNLVLAGRCTRIVDTPTYSSSQLYFNLVSLPAHTTYIANCFIFFKKKTKLSTWVLEVNQIVFHHRNTGVHTH